ncbi:hypothetical protein M5D96_001830 [Drosophila gunungcola]|uniref:Peptidase S1 domain-containing protein n=1 Tax=Drosophila gunungcola TaxID=103775 RepID=A0A9Q0BUY3_9MUSC|nr:hypothetical protein M5D96_001830 [Drosophila gunungcola]
MGKRNPEFVRLGEKDRSCITSNCSVVKEYSVDLAIKHPDYFFQFPVHKNDVAILKLNVDVEYNEFIKPICIIVDEEVNLADINQIQAFGWGITQAHKKKASDTLKTINLQLQSPLECLRSVQVNSTDEQFCARSPTGGDTCYGDSGGPVAGNYMYEGQSRYVQMGIVSFGSLSCNKSAIYTNVTSHRNWILTVLQTHGRQLLLGLETFPGVN